MRVSGTETGAEEVLGADKKVLLFPFVEWRNELLYLARSINIHKPRVVKKFE